MSLQLKVHVRTGNHEKCTSMMFVSIHALKCGQPEFKAGEQSTFVLMPSTWASNEQKKLPQRASRARRAGAAPGR